MRVLELFSGTHSVGKVCEKLNWEVISVDINNYKGKHNPTHQVDILNFNYKQYPKNHFDVVWASPPCVFYSRLQNVNLNRKRKDGKIYTKEKLEAKILLADSWVKKAIEIINFFQPKKWFIENPQTGKLKTRHFMFTLPYVDVDFCMYSDWGYRKRTRIWTNVKAFNPMLCNKQCGNMEMGDKGRRRHKLITDNGSSRRKGTNTLQRYRIPSKLIRELLLSS